MSKTTLDVLHTLLAAPQAGEHLLRETRDFWEADWDYDEMDALYGELVEEMEDLVADLTAVWGEPEFHGRWDDDDYPEWAFHDRIAFWQREGRYAYVAVRHEDKELPIELVLGVSDGALGGDRGAGEIPAGVQPPGADQRGVQPRPGAGRQVRQLGSAMPSLVVLLARRSGAVI